MTPNKIFTFFFILFASLKTSQGETCQPWKDNCSVDKYKCKIDCTKGASPTLCQINVSDGGVQSDDCPNDDELTAIDSINKMDGAQCKALCKTEKNCYYYRYEEIPHTDPEERSCYLMGNDQCDDFSDTKCGSSTSCESGVGSDNPCEGGDDGVVDEIYTCKGETQHEHGVMPDYKLHWACFSSGKEVDIETTKDIPGGTICTAKPECTTEIEYRCDPKDDTPGQTEGKWQFTTSDDPDMVENDGKLKDPICNANNLQLKEYATQVNKGMEILCVEEQVKEDGTIEAQNSCLLICDSYPILNFYTVAQSWMYQLMNEEPTPIPDENKPDDVIYCHKY